MFEVSVAMLDSWYWGIVVKNRNHGLFFLLLFGRGDRYLVGLVDVDEGEGGAGGDNPLWHSKFRRRTNSTRLWGCWDSR